VPIAANTLLTAEGLRFHARRFARQVPWWCRKPSGLQFEAVVDKHKTLKNIIVSGKR
jgi:hypothetical protein